MIAQPVGDIDIASAYPWDGIAVRANMVVTLDGAISDRDGVSRSLGTTTDHAVFSMLRRSSDLVLVGAGTLRAERYRPMTSGPTLCIVSRSLKIDPDDAVFSESTHRPIVLTCTTADATRLERISQVATVLAIGESAVDLVAGLDRLHALGFARVLCEGGPALLTDLLRLGRIDELCLSISARISGDPGAHRLVTPLDDPLRWRVEQVLFDADGLYTRLRPVS